MIHLYQNNGYNMVLDVNSGSVHVVEQLVYQVLSHLDAGKSDAEIQELLKAEYPEAEIREAAVIWKWISSAESL